MNICIWVASPDPSNSNEKWGVEEFFTQEASLPTGIVSIEFFGSKVANKKNYKNQGRSWLYGLTQGIDITHAPHNVSVSVTRGERTARPCSLSKVWDGQRHLATFKPPQSPYSSNKKKKKRGGFIQQDQGCWIFPFAVMAVSYHPVKEKTDDQGRPWLPPSQQPTLWWNFHRKKKKKIAYSFLNQKWEGKRKIYRLSTSSLAVQTQQSTDRVISSERDIGQPVSELTWTSG